MRKMIIYTDGGARGNQYEENIGAWAFVAVATVNGMTGRKEDYGASRNTTNNKMELQACIEALNFLDRNLKVGDGVDVEIHSDSAYVINGMNDWIYGWRQRGWINSKKKPVENRELWERLYALSNSVTPTGVKFVKVKGHADNEGNNRADELVNQAMDELEIPVA